MFWLCFCKTIFTNLDTITSINYPLSPAELAALMFLPEVCKVVLQTGIAKWFSFRSQIDSEAGGKFHAAPRTMVPLRRRKAFVVSYLPFLVIKFDFLL